MKMELRPVTGILLVTTLGLLLIGGHAAAEIAWTDTFASKPWTNSTAACMQGEAEARTAAKRLASPSILYRANSVTVNEWDPGYESQCQFVIERRVGSTWVTDSIHSYAHYSGGGNDPCPMGTRDNSGYCQPKDAGPSEAPCNGSNPINSGTANKYQREEDYQGAGVYPLIWRRHYNSLSNELGPLGQNWRHQYQRSVVITGISGSSANAVKLYREDGKRYEFTLSGDTWQGPTDLAFKLVQLFSSGIPNGWQITTEEDEKEIYNSEGLLVSISSRSGLTHTLAYDSNRRLASITDSHGRQIALGYDASNRIVTITLPGGSTITYGYDASQRLQSAAYPNTTSRTYSYNESAYTSGANLPRALTGITDEAGVRFASFTYDAQWRAIRSEHAGGVDQVSIGYGGTRTVTDALGTARSYTYSTVLGRILGTGVSQYNPVCGADNKTLSYDANGNVAARSNYSNIETRYSYDSTRNLETSRTEAYGTARARTISTSWHATHRLPIQIDEPNRRTTYTHDANGNVLTKTVTDLATNVSRTWTYTYNGYGQVLTANGPRTNVNDTTTYTYYSCTTGAQCGQLQTATDALGHVTTYDTYNAHGQPLTITDPNGIVTTLAYDARQRLTSRSVGGEMTSFEYWPTGLLKKVTLPDGSYLAYGYDAAHRLTQIQDADGNKVVYTLDAMGNRTAENLYDPSNALTRTHSRTYNSLNQLWKDIDAAGTAAVTTTFGYDNNGNLATINAPLTRNTENQYDELNRLTQVTDPASGVTLYGYDANDNLTAVTDPRSLVTSYQYNGFGEVVQQSSPDSGVTQYTYDSAGNVATRTDARSQVGTYSYDALNRVTQIQYGTHAVTYAYDNCLNGIGRLCELSDASGTTSWQYDFAGRVVQKTQFGQVAGNTATRIISYSYSNDRLVSLTMPSGTLVNYGYDVAGRVSSMNVTINGVTQTLLHDVLYDPSGAPRGWTWGNGTLSVREYDLDGRASLIDSADAHQYLYDTAGRITSKQSLTSGGSPLWGTWNYGYDALDRVTNAATANLSTVFNYSYDTNGNRLALSGNFNTALSYATGSNRLIHASGSFFGEVSFSYDAAGNQTSDGYINRSYDGAGRPTVINSLQYRYNGLGQMTGMQMSDNYVRHLSYDESGHYLELCGLWNSAGTCNSVDHEEYLWLGDLPVAAIIPRLVFDPAEGYLEEASRVLVYVHSDHLGTPRSITLSSDTTNQPVWRAAYEPFGGPLAGGSGSASGTSYYFSLRFPGQIYDGNAVRNYNYFRDYDPATGRYLQSDPIGVRGGTNTYVYARGNPISKFDKFGLMACNGRWVKYGEHVSMIPTGRQAIPAWTCTCYWMCIPCRGPWAWDGNIYGLPSSKGVTFVDYSGAKAPNTGSGGIRPTPKGPSRGGGGATGGAYSCLCAQKPGPESGCDTGQCYKDSNFNY